jgi:invasion protein IalB
MSVKPIAVATLLAVAFAAAVHAQSAPKSKGPASPAQPTPPAAAPPTDQGSATAPPAQGWAARCSSISRDAPLECAIEQTAVLTKTGQLIVLVNVRVPSDTRAPVAVVQLPLGLNLPAGAKLQIDDGKTVDLQVQTCETRGCYASMPVAPDMLAALKSGKQLKVLFQTMAKETITIPLPLGDFAAAYDKIK